MHKYAWICDSCDLDVHTEMARADPPPGWRIVAIYGEEDGAEPDEQHYCSDACAVVGTFPPDLREARRKELERERSERTE